MPLWVGAIGVASAGAQATAHHLRASVRVIGAISFLPTPQRLIPTGEIGKGSFGDAVAISADGTTALVGGGGDDNGVGAAWIFVRSGTRWTQQGPKLTGLGEVGKANFGAAVAISASGNTVLIGGANDNSFGAQTSLATGAAWVFVRSGTTWAQQGPKLTGGAGAETANFGDAVALSSNGDTALIGGENDGNSEEFPGFGAAWVFVRSGSQWTKQGRALTGSHPSNTELIPFQGEEFGSAVALSSDGNTALVGGYGDGQGADYAGAAWFFARSDSKWAEQGPKVTEAGDKAGAYFGRTLALSANGKTAFVEGFKTTVFVRSGPRWITQGPEIAGANSVSLTSNGTTALLALGTSSRVFARSGSTWPEQAQKLKGAGAVSLSGNGKVALLGNGGTQPGAAWILQAPGAIS